MKIEHLFGNPAAEHLPPSRAAHLYRQIQLQRPYRQYREPDILDKIGERSAYPFGTDVRVDESWTSYTADTALLLLIVTGESTYIASGDLQTQEFAEWQVRTISPNGTTLQNSEGTRRARLWADRAGHYFQIGDEPADRLLPFSGLIAEVSHITDAAVPEQHSFPETA